MSADRFSIHLSITDTRTETTTHRVFDRFPVRIGRHELNDFVLESGTASKFHAVIERDGQSLVLIDLGSTNGTIVNGATLEPQERVDLATGNFDFRIGPYDFRALRVVTRNESPVPATPTPAARPAFERVSASAVGLKTLAARFVPGALPFEDAGATLRFVGRIQEALDTLAIFYVAAHGATSTPRELLGRLLDPRRTSGDPAREIDNAVVQHTMKTQALMGGVVRGFACLLRELSPADIDDQLRREGISPTAGDLYEQRWRVLERRHQNLSGGLTSFAFLFGPEFAGALQRFVPEITPKSPSSAA